MVYVAIRVPPDIGIEFFCTFNFRMTIFERGGKNGVGINTGFLRGADNKIIE